MDWKNTMIDEIRNHAHEIELEELRAAAAAIEHVIKQKQSDLVLDSGGFVCSACGKATYDRDRHRSREGVCAACGRLLDMGDHISYLKPFDREPNCGHVAWIEFNHTLDGGIDGSASRARIMYMIVRLGHQFYELEVDSLYSDDDTEIHLSKLAPHEVPGSLIKPTSEESHV